MSRCEKHDLEIGSCADCRPRPGQPQATAAGIAEARKALRAGDEAVAAYLLDVPVTEIRRVSGRAAAPWFIAAYHGTCSMCGEDIEPDDEIRADGDGGWERRECCGEFETAR